MSGIGNPDERAQTFHLRPKVEPYEGGIRLVILRTARYDDLREEVEFGEVSVFVGPAFVITVRQGVASGLHGARTRLEQRPELLENGTNAVLWAILDQVVDDYGPVVAELERDIEQVEHTVFAGEMAPTERIQGVSPCPLRAARHSARHLAALEQRPRWTPHRGLHSSTPSYRTEHLLATAADKETRPTSSAAR